MSVFITTDDECSSTVASAAVKSVIILSRTRKICVWKNYIYLIDSEEILSQATEFLKAK